MLDVTITLDRFGRGKEIKPLVRIVIANTGDGDHIFANYEWWLSMPEHQYDDGLPAGKALARDLSLCAGHGYVEHFDRQFGPAVLLARVLEASGL